MQSGRLTLFKTFRTNSPGDLFARPLMQQFKSSHVLPKFEGLLSTRDQRPDTLPYVGERLTRKFGQARGIPPGSVQSDSISSQPEELELDEDMTVSTRTGVVFPNLSGIGVSKVVNVIRESVDWLIQKVEH